MKTKVAQAESMKKPKKDSDNEEEEEEEEVPKGPSSIVLVKEAKNPWEAMKERLQDSPVIKEILKRSKKVREQVAETDLGKRATNLGTPNDRGCSCLLIHLS